jgi:hypothetical protein
LDDDVNRYEYYPNGNLHKQWDVTARRYTEYAQNGNLIEDLAFTPEENARADADIAQRTAEVNYSDLMAKIPAALANNQTAITNLQAAVQALNTISTQTFNNQTQRDNALKSNSAHSATVGQHAIALTRQNNALLRIIGNLLDSQAGT